MLSPDRSKAPSVYVIR